jgi:hypothetical protein
MRLLLSTKANPYRAKPIPETKQGTLTEKIIIKKIKN